MSLFKGWIGEKKTMFYLWLSLSKKSYHKFHNVIILSNNGTTQFDHIVVSTYGIFIVETKNRKGWIYGSERQSKWTQTSYGNKYSFQNPLRQTFRHKKILAEYFNIKESHIRTVVYFVGNCKFKTQLPGNVIKSGVGRYIKRFRSPILSTEEVNRILEAMNKHLSDYTFTNRDHVRSLRQRLSSTTICPRCGGNLVERRAKKGPNAGSSFLGCENFPKCRFSKDI